jgi:hypothetical protein
LEIGQKHDKDIQEYLKYSVESSLRSTCGFITLASQICVALLAGDSEQDGGYLRMFVDICGDPAVILRNFT